MRPYPSDYFALTFVIGGAFLSGIHTLPGERLNVLAFSSVGALSGAIFIGLVDPFWLVRLDLVVEAIAATVVLGAILTRLAGVAGRALNNPFGHQPD